MGPACGSHQNRRVLPRSGGLTRFIFSPLAGAVAGHVELQDGGVMDQAVDGGSGRHRILEDPFPITEHQIAGNQHRAPFVAFGD